MHIEFVMAKAVVRTDKKNVTRVKKEIAYLHVRELKNLNHKKLRMYILRNTHTKIIISISVKLNF